MDPVTPAAPAAPAPAASAPAPAASSGGFLDHLGMEEKQPLPEPEMDAPLGDALAPQTPSTPQEGQPPAEPAAVPEEPKPEGANPQPASAPTAWQPTHELTKTFKDPKDLEVAYVQSSMEGLRLAKVVKDHEALVDQANAKLRDLEDQIAVGQELKPLTDAEVAAMTPQQVAQHEVRMHEQQRLKKDLDQRKKSEAKQTQEREESRVNLIKTRTMKMESDTVNFPDFGELKPLMNNILDAIPQIAGYERSPDVLYFFAKGYRAHEMQKASKAAAAKSAEDAKAKAAADAAGAGGTGKTGSEKTPAGSQREIDPKSDEAHNLRLLRGNRPQPIF